MVTYDSPGRIATVQPGTIFADASKWLLIPTAIPPILFSIQPRLVEKVKVTVKTHLALLSLSIAIAAPSCYAVSPRSSRPVLIQSAALTQEAHARTPRSLAVRDAATDRHLFPVNDEKGLLLTCVAPEIDQNSETDQFNNCNLAPGRTLDDVMHSFISGIHEEQRQHQRESAIRQSAEERDKADSARK
jgi:hypothetical protein